MMGKAGGFSVTVAVPDFVLSATLVAVTVTVWVEPIDEGAVYRPAAEIVPTLLGLIAQFREVLEVPVTVGVNCWVWPPDKLLVPGARTTETGTRVTVVEADLVGSAALVAVTVTDCPEAMEAGAV